MLKNALGLESLRKRRFPLDAREQFEVAHRRDECVLVLGRKGPIDPIEEPGKRDADVLRVLARDDA